MNQDFTHATLGRTGLKAHRLGLSATYRPSKKTLYKALDEGLNYFFFFGIDTPMIGFLRDVLRTDRDKYIVATGAYNLLLGHTNLRRTLEKRLKQLGTDCIDVFLFLGVTKEKHFPERLKEELCLLREDNRVKYVGISTHNRKFAGKLALEGALDVLMVRYNAAHRGAEQEIFPFLDETNLGVVSFTATRWRYLLRRPRGWPKDGPIPTAGMCYRFVLSNPHVHVCMTAPTTRKQLEKNLDAIRKGPLDEEDMAFMRKFGDVVHNAKKWFM